MGGYIFDKVIKQSQNFEGSVWDKQRIKENDHFYTWLHERIEFWTKNGKNKKSIKGKI